SASAALTLALLASSARTAARSPAFTASTSRAAGSGPPAVSEATINSANNEPFAGPFICHRIVPAGLKTRRSKPRRTPERSKRLCRSERPERSKDVHFPVAVAKGVNRAAVVIRNGQPQVTDRRLCRDLDVPAPRTEAAAHTHHRKRVTGMAVRV